VSPTSTASSGCCQFMLAHSLAQLALTRRCVFADSCTIFVPLFSFHACGLGGGGGGGGWWLVHAVPLALLRCYDPSRWDRDRCTWPFRLSGPLKRTHAHSRLLFVDVVHFSFRLGHASIDLPTGEDGGAPIPSRLTTPAISTSDPRPNLPCTRQLRVSCAFAAVRTSTDRCICAGLCRTRLRSTRPM
jgi:hypothetical protein